MPVFLGLLAFFGVVAVAFGSSSEEPDTSGPPKDDVERPKAKGDVRPRADDTAPGYGFTISRPGPDLTPSRAVTTMATLTTMDRSPSFSSAFTPDQRRLLTYVWRAIDAYAAFGRGDPGFSSISSLSQALCFLGTCSPDEDPESPETRARQVAEMRAGLLRIPTIGPDDPRSCALGYLSRSLDPAHAGDYPLCSY